MILYFTFEKNNKTQLTELPLRFALKDVYKIDLETVPVGVVKTGVLRPGMKVTFVPSSTRDVEVKMVDFHLISGNMQMNEAMPGDNASFSVKGAHVQDIKRGMIAGDADDPPSEAESFTALVTVLNHPGEIGAGYTAVVDVHTARVKCTFARMLQKYSSPGSAIEENAEKIKQGDVALVELVPTKPLCVETFKDYPPLGHITVTNNRTNVAVGIITSVKKKET